VNTTPSPPTISGARNADQNDAIRASDGSSGSWATGTPSPSSYAGGLLPVELWNEYDLPSTVNRTVGYQCVLVRTWPLELRVVLVRAVSATTVPSVRSAEARKLAVEETRSDMSPARPVAPAGGQCA
jgi:hypothetical protein